MPKTPPQASLQKIYLPTSKIKPVRVNLAIFWRLRRKFATKLSFPKKSTTERQLQRIYSAGARTSESSIYAYNSRAKRRTNNKPNKPNKPAGKNTLKKAPPSGHRTQIYLPTSGMGSYKNFLCPAL